MLKRQCHSLGRLILAAGLIFSLTGGQSLAEERAAAHRNKRPAARLQGTFLQLLEDHGRWQRGDWKKLFWYFERLQLKTLVIQWTVYDDLGFAPGLGSREVKNPPLETILELAEKSGIKVFVGLVHNSDYWDKIQKDPSALRGYFARKLQRAVSVADQLAEISGRHASFTGWYLPEEVDDVNWKASKPRQIFFSYLRDIRAHLQEISPDKKVAISGFSNAAMTPNVLEEFWKGLLKTTGIDTVLFQDGIGVHKLSLAQLPVYLGAVRGAALSQSREFQVVVEIFSQISGAPIDNKPFKAVPAPLRRIKKQLHTASRYTSSLTAFSIPEYMTPLGGPKAKQLFLDYLNSK